MSTRNAICCFTVDDVCYEGYSTEDHLAHFLEFFGEHAVKATFFVVPLAQKKRLGERREYVSVLKRALSEGHEVGQHGLEHDRFETGIPPEMILALPHEGPAREHLRKHRKQIEESHQVNRLRETLSQGREILQQSLGQEIKGFRAPALSTCENLFHALEAEKYEYDTSRCLQEAGWDILNNRPYVPRPITRERFDSLQYPGALRTLPLTTDYTWYLAKDKFQMALHLAKHDCDACLESAIPLVPVCHVSPIHQGEDDCGFELYRELITYANHRASDLGLELEMLTLSQACGRFPWAETPGELI